MKILIIAHQDPDGIFSAHMLKTRYSLMGSGNEIKVIFSNWHRFGIPEDMKSLTSLEDADKVFVIDLGTDIDKILLENQWADEGKTVVHIDHHPTNIVFIDEKTLISPSFPETIHISPNLDIVWSSKNCAAGLTYLKIQEMAQKGEFGMGIGVEHVDLLRWIPIWALLGIYADAAVSTKGGQSIISSLRDSFPSFFCDWFQESMKGFEEWGGEVRIPLTSLIGRFFNTPRKIVFDKGPELALRACEEINKTMDFSILLKEDLLIDADSPASALLRNLEKIHTKEIFRIVKDEDYIFYDFTTRGYVFIEHRWNIGSDIARLLSRRYNKGITAVNFGLPEIELGNGRNPQRTTLLWDLGKVYSSVSNLFPECLTGGGHPNAAAIAFKKGTSHQKVLNMLEGEFRKIEPRRGN